jgi:hypothetical protein
MKFPSPKPGFILFFVFVTIAGRGQVAAHYDTAFVESLKKQALASVTGKEKLVQEMVDMVFSLSPGC